MTGFKAGGIKFKETLDRYHHESLRASQEVTAAEIQRRRFEIESLEQARVKDRALCEEKGKLQKQKEFKLAQEKDFRQTLEKRNRSFEDCR